ISFTDTATPELYTLSLHDALPIFVGRPGHFFPPGVHEDPHAQDQRWKRARDPARGGEVHPPRAARPEHEADRVRARVRGHEAVRSEEHTSELQSRSDLVCRLLLEK